MKKLFLILLLSLSLNAFSQILDPVKWTTSVEKVSDSKYKLITKATIESGWHLYSQNVPEDGPIPTTFLYGDEDDTAFKVIGNTSEDIGHTVDDPVFNMKIKFFEESATFTQTIEVIDSINEVRGTVEFMVCDDTRCLPPTEVDLVFNFNNSNKTQNSNTLQNGSVDNDNINKLLYGMVPEDIKLTEVTSVEKKSLWTIFVLGFLGGLLALLTPCVFPMIPLTVSFFTKQSQNKKTGIINSIFYGLSIIIIYVILGTIITVIFGASALNEMSTAVSFNIVFFIILVVFAISFFGYFEITLPSSWANKVDSKSNKKGFIGIFFMALALAIVSFSCTGPVVGGLLVEAASKGGMAPVLGMLGFSTALALPFSLFAAFPGWLNSLPKSGGWLNTTKVILGFLELALAFKFLSNADLVKRWGILKIEPFLVIWIIIFAGLALYLFGKIKFPHDSPIKKLSFSRIAGGILVASFAIYLASGFRVNKETNTFTSLTLLSGLAPPVGYSWFLPSNTTNNLKTFKDLKEGIVYAKQVNKPIMIDFTGYACVNCRKMEEHIWPLEKIDSYLRNDYVLISLYVDDKKDLPDNQKVEVNRVNGGTRLLKNYGHKWANFQTQFFKSNSQPYYVLFNPNNNEVLNEPVGYTPDEDEYAQFLQKGLDAFNKQN